MTERELTLRVRAVLRDLGFLSDASAIAYDGDRVKSGGSKSAPPPGVRFGGRDLRDLSLCEYWADRFHKVRGDVPKLEFFLYLAERDLARAKRRQQPRDPHEPDSVREQRVVDQYEGLSAMEAAVAEDCAELWIRKVRFKALRDPDTGWVQYVSKTQQGLHESTTLIDP